MQIRRDRSNLRFGKQGRRGNSGWLFGLWLLAMTGIVFLMIYFQDAQSAAMQFINGTSTPTQSAVSLAVQASGAFQQGNVASSVELYRQATAMEPDNLDIQFEFVRALMYRSFAGRNFLPLQGEALQIAQEIVDRHPRDARAQAMYTLALTLNSRSEEAIAAGIRAVELAPQWAEAHAYLSMAYQDQRRYNASIESAERAVELDPNSVDAKRALALSLAYVGEFDLAIQTYEEAIRISPRLDALYFEMAIYYTVKDNYAAAIAAFDQVLANDPSNVKAYTRKCEIYFQQREDARAQESCEQALLLDNTYPEAWRQLGMVQYTRRNYEGAIESFSKCAEIQEGLNVPLAEREIECWYLRGLSHFLLDECDKAVPLFEEVLTMTPNEVAERFTYQGLESCAAVDERFDMDIVPTPIPPTEVPPEPIGIF